MDDRRRAHDGRASFLPEDALRRGSEDFDPTLTKAEASKRIDSLQRKTGRGR